LRQCQRICRDQQERCQVPSTSGKDARITAIAVVTNEQAQRYQMKDEDHGQNRWQKGRPGGEQYVRDWQ